jgi:hypothetical protein
VETNGLRPWTQHRRASLPGPTHRACPCEPQGEDFSPSPASLPQLGTLFVPSNGGPQLRRPRRRNTTVKRPQPLSQREQLQIRCATARAYFRFCNECSAYPHNLANYLTIMDWIDERRIEMLAEGRPRWVLSEHDYWQAMRDCWDDLVKCESHRK